jgi:hypothetical protein
LRPVVVALLFGCLLACDGGGGGPPVPRRDAQVQGTLDIIFLNQLEGYAEGVPCDPDGTSPLAAAAELRDRMVAEGRDAVLLVAIGSSLFGRDDPRPMLAHNTALLGRGNAILEAFAAAKLDLWVPGPVEMALNAGHVLDRCAELGLPLLISNLRFKQEEARAEDVLPWYVVQAGTLRVALLGMIGQPPEPDPELIEENPERANRRSRLVVRSAVEAAGRRSKQLRDEEGVHVVIVLSALARGINLRLAQAEGVDMVIGNTGEQFPAGRVVIEGSTAMLSAGHRGEQVGHVTLEVRDGDLQFIDLSPLHTLPAESEELKRELRMLAARYGTDDVQSLARLVAPGNPEEFLLRYRMVQDADEFVGRYAGYEGSALRHRAAELPTPTPGHPVLQALAGQGAAIDAAFASTRLRPAAVAESHGVIPDVDSCRDCHGAQVRFWEQTAHASAYATLRSRGRGRDPGCLPCHAAGFADVTGWIDPRLDAPLGPVTCFSCHRLSSVHATNRIQVLNPAHYVSESQYMNCEACHDARRSPGFDRDEVLASVTCPPMRPDEPALVFARERAVEAIEARRARGDVEPQDDYLLGLGLLGLSRTDEGARHLQDAAATNRKDVRQAIETAHALDRCGLSEEAIVVLRTYLDHQTGDPLVNLEHVRLMLEARDPAARDPREALAVLDLLLPDDEADFTVEQLPFQLLQVDALEALGEAEEAESLLKTLAMRYQDDSEVRRRLAKRGLMPR